VPVDDAAVVVENLIEADLRGVYSHGVVRFPIYVKRILDGGASPKASMSILRETRTTAVVDGDNGLGHLVGVKAMQLAIEKASEGDCVFVAVKTVTILVLRLITLRWRLTKHDRVIIHHRCH